MTVVPFPRRARTRLPSLTALEEGLALVRDDAEGEVTITFPAAEVHALRREIAWVHRLRAAAVDLVDEVT